MNNAGPATPAPLRGLLLIDKPEGPTSMDVCRRVRRRLIAGGAPKRVKVGHGGTLDPLATGLLVILVGRSTPLCDTIMAGAKRYIAGVDLSARSATDDREGPVTSLDGLTPPSLQHIRQTLDRFVGQIEQAPPAFSAVKIDGQRAYRMARRGEAVAPRPRPVLVHSIDVLSYDWPLLTIDLACGKGFYVRSLARDLGAALGVGGMLASLRRTRIGSFDIRDARPLDTLPDVLRQADLLEEPRTDAPGP